MATSGLSLAATTCRDRLPPSVSAPAARDAVPASRGRRGRSRGRIQLTEPGRDAIARIREAGARGMLLALADWSPEELRRLATLFHRMVDDFLAYAKDIDGEHEQTEAGPRAR